MPFRLIHQSKAFNKQRSIQPLFPPEQDQALPQPPP